jgi:hypothetical protein
MGDVAALMSAARYIVKYTDEETAEYIAPALQALTEKAGYLSEQAIILAGESAGTGGICGGDVNEWFGYAERLRAAKGGSR